jgi:hypothetical protein
MSGLQQVGDVLLDEYGFVGRVEMNEIMRAGEGSVEATDSPTAPTAGGTQHSLLPWNAFIVPINDAADGCLIDCPDPANGGWSVAEAFGPDARANVEFIVRACNSHYELMGALRGLLENEPSAENTRRAIAAIRKAEGA